MRNHPIIVGRPPVADEALAGPALSLYVMATTDAGTRAALSAAGAFARDLRARVVLLVPHVVPYAQALDHPADPAAFAGERYRDVAASLGLNVTIRVCICRDAAAVAAMVPTDAVVLVGGRRRGWYRPWRSREERLVRDLERKGRRVLLIC